MAIAQLNTFFFFFFLQEAINQALQLNASTFLNTLCDKLVIIEGWLLSPTGICCHLYHGVFQLLTENLSLALPHLALGLLGGQNTNLKEERTAGLKGSKAIRSYFKLRKSDLNADVRKTPAMPAM